ncbi:MAG: acyl transferase [Chitinophagaceae bacterium]
MNGNLPTPELLTQQVFSIKNGKDFTTIALAIFNFQYYTNQVYRSYCDLVHTKPSNVSTVNDIPFLPISFFKTHEIVSTAFYPEVVFESSRTTGATPSKHLVKDASIYTTSFFDGFQLMYGAPVNYCFLGLLPSYLERENSSLVYMVEALIQKSSHPLSGFYLYDFEKLAQTIQLLEANGQQTMLIGVTHALIDFAEKYPMKLQHTKVMETGGMKGRKREMVRSELQELLKNAFSVSNIHSEYGMTELLSQAYAKENGLFSCPPWMKVLLRPEDDPLSIVRDQEITNGAINIIDLANIYSCSFLATEDVGKLHNDGSFEILGRLDNSDIRGCSLMVL